MKKKIIICCEKYCKYEVFEWKELWYRIIYKIDIVMVGKKYGKYRVV